MEPAPATAGAVLERRSLGRMDYERCLALQRELAAERAAGQGADTLLLVEHPPVFTLGRRRGAEANVRAAGDTPVVRVERGGDVTWHGPGQLVGYPIVRLEPGERDVHAFLRGVEEALIRILGALGLPGERHPEHTGVWCAGAKVASIGVACRDWVTNHGFALNVDPDLSWYDRINPCGLSSEAMSSVARLGGTVPPWDELESLAHRELARALDREPGTPSAHPEASRVRSDRARWRSGSR